MDICEIVEYKSVKVPVYYDDMCDWIADWEHIPTFVFEHGKYRLGHIHDVEGVANDLLYEYVSDDRISELEKIWGDAEDWSARQRLKAVEDTGEVVVLWVSAYEHGGISIWCEDSPRHFDSCWDCGTIGFAYIEKKNFVGEYNQYEASSWKEDAIEIIKEEVAEYSGYLNGEVYRCELPDGEVYSGYIGDCGLDMLEKDIREHLNYYIDETYFVHDVGHVQTMDC